MHINEIIKYGEIKPGGKLLLTPEQLNDAIAFIKRRCKKILEDYRKTNRIFYRGTSTAGDIFIGKPIANRRPVDTNPIYQKLLDNKLSLMGFKALRSNSIFVTSSEYGTSSYGSQYAIFPIDGFSYTWTPLADDLTNTFDLAGKNYSNDFVNDLYDLDNKEFVKKYEFKNNVGIYNVLRSGNEVYINGPYVAVKTDILIFSIIMYEVFGDISSEKIIINRLRREGTFLRYIKNPTQKMIWTAVMSDGNALQWVNNPSKELIHRTVKKWPLAIQFVREQDENMQLSMLSNYPWAFGYLINPSERVIEYAVAHNGSVINNIKNPSEKLKKLAVINDGAVLLKLLDDGPVSDELKIIGLKTFPAAINLINDPTEEMQLTAVTADGLVLRYINNIATPDIQLAAVKQDVFAIQYIKNPSKEIQIAAVTRDPSIVDRIFNLCDEAKKLSDKLKRE